MKSAIFRPAVDAAACKVSIPYAFPVGRVDYDFKKKDVTSQFQGAERFERHSGFDNKAVRNSVALVAGLLPRSCAPGLAPRDTDAQTAQMLTTIDALKSAVQSPEVDAAHCSVKINYVLPVGSVTYDFREQKVTATFNSRRLKMTGEYAFAGAAMNVKDAIHNVSGALPPECRSLIPAVKP